ncbi:MAG: radical SAM protein [Planctomycetes bacterium]|nr:radical SAM protein [Planctomycetota bacterium]
MIQRPGFPISLIFPPQGHFTQPYLALPCLKAWLVQHGFDDVELVDANIDAYDRFLSREYLTRARDRVRERLPHKRFAGRAQLEFRELAAFRAATEAEVSADALIERIDDAKSIVRGGAFHDIERYIPATRTIYHALRLVSAAHFPSELTPHNFTTGYANDRSREVLAATLDETQNPFIDHFRTHVLPDLIARSPRVVGMSVIYGSQLIPALTLGRMIKAALPDCHITAGGGFLAYIGAKLMAAPGIDACLDSIIFHEGESPLLALCERLRDGHELGDVGSLTWFDRSRGGVRTVTNALGHPIKLDDAPPPDFGGLPLARYFSPELVIPYDINRGCYYGECTFCTLPTVIGPGYRTRSAATIADHIVRLRDELGTRNVNFITDCMPPGMIRDLPHELIARRADIRWWSDARVEPKAYTPEGARKLHESGCRKLLFGFETATPRLLKMMMKGQSLKSTIEVATNCARAGISVTFYAMVGFPTETRAEAQATVDFLVEHKDIVREVSLQTFHIDEVAKTYREPEAFGIKILSDPAADLQLYHDYEAASGMTQTEAAEVFEDMMASLRAHYPLFTGDNIFFFMQKSHYFLHLARGVTPDEFNDRCRRRAERRASAGPEAALSVGEDTRLLAVPFSYTETLAKLAHPLARAARPDFLTGRFVESAENVAARELGAIQRKERVLVYCGETAEFAEIRPDGARALDALRQCGSLGELLDLLPAHDQAARANLTSFAAELHRLGVLTTLQSASARA